METPQLFDEIATHYERWSNFLSAEGIRAWHHFAVERLAVQTGQTILDVGCGTGAITSLLAAKTGPAGHVTGLDPSRSMLNEARRQPRRPNDAPIQWVEGRGEALPFADAQFDRVTAQFSLRNMEDWIQGLYEMMRVLKPNGRLVVLDVVQPISSLGSLAGSVLKTATQRFGGGDGLAPYQWLGLSIEHAPTRDEICFEARRMGLVDISVHHWLGDLVMVLSGVKQDAARASTPAIQPRIVWAVDGSVTALSCADWINRVAAPGSLVDIVTVIPTAAAAPEVLASDARAWRRHAQRAYEHLTPGRFVVRVTVLNGDPGTEIVRFCQHQATHLLVVGDKGRSSRADHWIGSVARHVAEHAHCPAILLPLDGE